MVDGSNSSIQLPDAVVQLYSHDGDKLAETTSGPGGHFSLTPPRAVEWISIVVQPGPYTDYMGTDENRCQYRWTQHNGLTAAASGDLGAVGLARKDGGNCRAPVGAAVRR